MKAKTKLSKKLEFFPSILKERSYIFSSETLLAFGPSRPPKKNSDTDSSSDRRRIKRMFTPNHLVDTPFTLDIHSIIQKESIPLAGCMSFGVPVTQRQIG